MSRVLRVIVGRDQVRAELVRRRAVTRKAVTWAAEAEHDGPAALADAIAHLAGELGPDQRTRRVVVELHQPLVQLRTLDDLPPVRSGALAALVALQAGRFFRRNGTPLVTDASWLNRGWRSQWRHWRLDRKLSRPRSAALAAAVEASWVEAIVAGARVAGLRLETITPAVAPGKGGKRRLELLPPGERRLRRRQRWGSIRQLGVAVAVLWLLVGTFYVGRLVRERRRIEHELARLKEPAAAVLAARREVADAQAMVETVARAEQRRGWFTLAVARVATALPDSAYLASLQLDLHDPGAAGIDQASGIVTGAAVRAIDVVAAFERAGIPGARIDGPVVGEHAGGRQWERFTIRFGKDGS